MRCEVCGKQTDKITLTVRHCPECGTIYKGGKVRRPVIVAKFVHLTQAVEQMAGQPTIH